MLQWEAVWGFMLKRLSDTWHQRFPWVALEDTWGQPTPGVLPWTQSLLSLEKSSTVFQNTFLWTNWEGQCGSPAVPCWSHSNDKALSCICAVDLFQAEKADQAIWLFTFYHLSSFLIFKLHKAFFPLLPKPTRNLYTKPADEAGHCIPAGLEQPLPTDGPHLPLLSHCQHSGRRQSCLRGSSAQTNISGIWIQVLLTPWGQQRTVQKSAYLYLCASSCGGSVPFSHYLGMLAEQHEFTQAEFLLSGALRDLKFGHF